MRAVDAKWQMHRAPRKAQRRFFISLYKMFHGAVFGHFLSKYGLAGTGLHCSSDPASIGSNGVSLGQDRQTVPRPEAENAGRAPPTISTPATSKASAPVARKASLKLYRHWPMAERGFLPPNTISGTIRDPMLARVGTRSRHSRASAGAWHSLSIGFAQPPITALMPACAAASPSGQRTTRRNPNVECCRPFVHVVDERCGNTNPARRRNHSASPTQFGGARPKQRLFEGIESLRLVKPRFQKDCGPSQTAAAVRQ